MDLEKRMNQEYSNAPEDERIAENNRVQVHVDAKQLVISNYIAKRVSQLAGQSLEIGWYYLGTATHKESQYLIQTKIDINQIVIPSQQRIFPAFFDIQSVGGRSAQEYATKVGKKIVGIGHSHASFSIFHSQRDYDEFKVMAFTKGVEVKNPNKKLVSTPYPMLCKGKKSIPELRKIPRFRAESLAPYNVLPSLVFNERNEPYEFRLGVNNPYAKPMFSLRPWILNIYNKKVTPNVTLVDQELTSIEKFNIDQQIIRVLEYNKIPHNYHQEQTDRMAEGLKKHYHKDHPIIKRIART